MKLRLYGKPDLVLPSDLDADERIALADEVVNTNPESFRLTGYSVADNKVKVRLDILGSYILNAVENKEKEIMTRYKQKRRPYQEKVFSNLPSYQKHLIDNLTNSLDCREQPAYN